MDLELILTEYCPYCKRLNLEEIKNLAEINKKSLKISLYKTREDLNDRRIDLKKKENLVLKTVPSMIIDKKRIIQINNEIQIKEIIEE